MRHSAKPYDNRGMSNNVQPLSEEPADAAPVGSDGVREQPRGTTHAVTVRRSPRYFRLMALGAGLGAIAAFIATFAVTPSEDYSPAQVFGFLLLFGIVIGGVLGAVIGLVLERIVGRRTISVTANKLAVQGQDESTAQH